MNRHASTLILARQLFGLGGGLMLLLAPRDGRVLMHPPMREFYVLSVAVFVSVALLAIFKSYLPLGIAISSVMVCASVQVVWGVGAQLIQASAQGGAFSFTIEDYTTVCWGAVWFIPFMICLAIRLLARNGWDNPKQRVDFTRFFRLAVRCFAAYYFLIFVVLFFLVGISQVPGGREYSFTPFSHILSYRNNGQDFSRYLFGNLFFFSPLGFFCSVRHPKWRWWAHLLFILSLCTGVEFLQYALHCGTVNVDDVMLNCIGYLLGAGVRPLMDALRRAMTGHEESGIRYY